MADLPYTDRASLMAAIIKVFRQQGAYCGDCSSEPGDTWCRECREVHERYAECILRLIAKDPVTQARAVLAAVGDTGHRVVSEERIKDLEAAAAYRAAKSMRERAHQTAYQDLSTEESDIADAIRALPLHPAEPADTREVDAPPTDYRTLLVAELLGEDRGDAAQQLGDDPADTWERAYAVWSLESAELERHRRGESPVLDRVAALERDRGEDRARLARLDDRVRSTESELGPVTWSDTAAPGGYVCAAPEPNGICGQPIESEPCREHSLPGQLATVIERLDALERAARAPLTADTLKCVGFLSGGDGVPDLCDGTAGHDGDHYTTDAVGRALRTDPVPRPCPSRCTFPDHDAWHCFLPHGHPGRHESTDALWTDDAGAPPTDYRTLLVAELLGEDRGDAAQMLADDPADTWERAYAVWSLESAELERYRHGEVPLPGETDTARLARRFEGRARTIENRLDVLELADRERRQSDRAPRAPVVGGGFTADTDT